jgi:transposase
MVLAQCDEPGMSVAQVAMSLGINDNVVHRRRQLARQQQCARQAITDTQPSTKHSVAFVPLALPAPDEPQTRTEVRLDIKRGAVTVGVAWPTKALGDLAGFVSRVAEFSPAVGAQISPPG